MNRTTVITTPAESYDLISLANLKADLSIAGSADDTFLQRAITKASLAAARYCDRTLVNEAVEDRFYFDGRSVGSVKLSHFPVTAIQSVVIDGATLVVDEGYLVDKQSGVLYRGGWSGEQLVVAYTGGYVDVPLDLQGATTDIVKALQFNRTRDPMLRSENILSGLYAYTLFDASSGASSGTALQVRNTLDSYRVVFV